MKALSLKQPFAELIVSGRKTIEIRKWNTKFRGEFFIHASKNPDKKAMEKFGFGELPLGCLVGKAKIDNVKKYIDENEFIKDKGKHLADISYGNYGFILKNAERIKEIQCGGKLGFWDISNNKNK